MNIATKFLILTLSILATACLPGQAKQNVLAADPDKAGMARLAKSDINEVVELHQRAVMGHLKELMVKLYRRNPQGRHDQDHRTIEASVDYFFSQPHTSHFPEWQDSQASDLIRMALDQNYQGSDRVLPYVYGLRKMLMAAYNNRTEFFYFSSINEQKLYNSARNIEIAAWIISNKRDGNGNLLIITDSLAGEQRNLSYQRLFGKMIATQDNLAEIIARKQGRAIKTVVVQLASLVFLPI